MFFQQLVNGLSIGSIYALMAVGYSLIYSLLNFTNFAHSITVTIGAFCAFFFLSNLVQNLYLGIAIAVLVAGGLAMLIELLGYRPLLQKKARRIYLLITGLGISTMCENLENAKDVPCLTSVISIDPETHNPVRTASIFKIEGTEFVKLDEYRFE